MRLPLHPRLYRCPPPRPAVSFWWAVDLRPTAGVSSSAAVAKAVAVARITPATSARSGTVVWCLHRGRRFSNTTTGNNHNHRAVDSFSLPRPKVIYQSNHLLAVYKPPGWHSIPNISNQGSNNREAISKQQQQQQQQQHYRRQDDDDDQCLLRYLREEKLGGGSRRQFLKPLHRLDQPCSGVILFGKTTKAASRIQSGWSQVHKIYYAVVTSVVTSLDDPTHGGTDVAAPTTTTTNDSKNDDTTTTEAAWRRLTGKMLRRRRNKNATGSSRDKHNHQGGWSVTMLPCRARNDDDNNSDNNNNDTGTNKKNTTNGDHDDKHWRYCELEYRTVGVVPKRPPLPPKKQQQQPPPQYRLLEIRTRHGARHMIRAMLACYKMPIAGDVRYHRGGGGGGSSSSNTPLRDRSVALHAYRLQLPASLQLGPPLQQQQQQSPPLHQMQRSFCAPIPPQWSSYFGWCEQDIQRWNAVAAAHPQ